MAEGENDEEEGGGEPAVGEGHGLRTCRAGRKRRRGLGDGGRRGRRHRPLPGRRRGSDSAALATIGEALEELGASFRDVVRTRILLADASRWEDAARAHGEIFGDVRPANTTMGGLEFIDPAILVEVEASAVVEPG